MIIKAPYNLLAFLIQYLNKITMKSRSFCQQSPPKYKDCCRPLTNSRRPPKVCTHNKSMNNSFVLDKDRQTKPKVIQKKRDEESTDTGLHLSVTAPVPAQPSLQEKFNSLLLDQNQKFLRELGTFCCKKKPMWNRKYRGPRLNPNTTYMADYVPKERVPNPRQPNPELPKQQYPAQKQSQYLDKYPQHPVQQKYRREPQRRLDQYPMFSRTTYSTFHNGPSGPPAESFPPNNNNDYISGQKFNPRTTYRSNYTPQKNLRGPPHKVKSFMDPITGPKIPLNTTYGDQFRPKTTFSQRPYLPNEQRVPRAQGSYETEYGGEYPDKFGNWLNKCHKKLAQGVEQVLRQ